MHISAVLNLTSLQLMCAAKLEVYYRYMCATSYVVLVTAYIGGDTIEALKHGPPQILGPGGTLEHASSDFGCHFCRIIIILLLLFL